MKKTYYSPKMDVIELKTSHSLRAGSGTGAEGGGSDGGSGVTPTDPSQEGWGDDY